MTTDQSKIKSLLARIEASRGIDASKKLSRPHSEPNRPLRIMTLRPGHYRQLSPMLTARFMYMGRWTDAHLSQDWLDISEINDWPNIEPVPKRLELRKENWDFVPPGSEAPENCAIFAVNPYELDETYLLWTQDEEEPQVWELFGADFKMFLNLERYLEFVLGDRQKDDAQRDQWDPNEN